MTYQIIRCKGIYPFHVVDSLGLPHTELTLYACTAHMFHASKTAQSYLGDVVNFASWAKTNPVAIRQSWHLLGTPNEIRSLISFFLAVEMKCVVVLGKDKLGFETKRIEPTWETSRRLERLFAALRSFYNVLRSKGLYIYENPMEGQGARDLIADERRRVESEFFQANGRHSMNPESGVDPIRLERMSAAYFRLRGDKWTPFIIDDPLLFNIILSAGEKWGWTLREIGIVRLLFDTGCRIHEACNLTMGDWSHSGFQKELMAISKGSHGRRVKRLFITDRTVKVLQQYVDEQRKELDPERRTLSEMGKLPSSTLRALPLFLTRAGKALEPDHFRRNFWVPALESKKLRLRLHQVRHWFVTMALNDIHKRAKTDEELQNLRSELRELMAWRSDMLPIYDQAMRRLDIPNLASNIHKRIEAEHLLAITRLKSQPSLENNREKSESQRLLEEMLGI